MFKKKGFLIYFFLLTSIVFIIAIIRSIKMGITCDEAITYRVFIMNNSNLQYLNTIANNHFLNTLLVKILDTILNIKYNEFIIRIPNLIFYIIYIIGVFKLSCFYKNKVAISTVLLLNYSINEFFSIARGYGIASALVIVGIYFYKKWLNDHNFNDFKKTIFLLLLSSMANTIVLVLLICILFDFILKCLKSKEMYLISKHWKFFISSGFLFLLLFLYQLFIMKTDTYLLSCSDNFFSCFVKSPLIYFGFSQMQSIIIGLIFILTFIFIYINYSYLEFKNSIFNIFILVLSLFLFLKIIGISYPTTRSLIPFFPIYIISFFDTINVIKNKNLRFIICSILITISFISFFSNIHFDYIREWEHDRYTKKNIEQKYKNNKSIFLENTTKVQDVAANYYYEKYHYYKKISNKEYKKIINKLNKK